MKRSIPRDSDGPEFSRVTRHFRDKDGIKIGKSSDHFILDTRMYEIEYIDRHKSSLASNAIAENMFTQVGVEVNIHVLFE